MDMKYPDLAREIWEALSRRRAGSTDVPPIGLVVQGGGMRGVYSLGVLAALEEMGFGSCFDHVAGSSAGAHNGIHLITGQARYGVETYIDYLSNRHFIDLLRVNKLVDIDYLLDHVVRWTRPFNLAALVEASTILHIALTDAQNATAHYVTNRTPGIDLWEAFRATAAMPILYNQFVRVGDRLYLDGSLSDCLPLQRVVDCGCRYIVVVLTKPLSFRSKRISAPLRALAWQATRHYNQALKQALFDEDRNFNSTMDALSENNGLIASESTKILAIAPNDGSNLVTCITTDPKQLRQCALQARADAWRAFGWVPPPKDNPFRAEGA
ncbi:MAG: patatin-like phospholipase family protein [Nitrospiraceae bacterium]